MKAKRFLSVLCCLSLIGTLLVPSALAAGDSEPIIDESKYDFIEGELAYKKLDETTVEVAVYQKINPPTHDQAGAFVVSLYNGKTLSVPATVTHESQSYTVAGIGWGAFEDATPISLTLAEGIGYIADNAFVRFGLTALTIPASVTEIREDAFASSSLQTITFSDNSGLKTIGDSAFAGCSALTALTLSASVETIGGAVFAGCTSLSAVMIPASVTSLDPNAFGSGGSTYPTGYYGSGHTITFAEGCKYKLQDGVLYDDESLLHVYEVQSSVTIPEGIKYIGEGAFKVMPNTATDSTLTSITFPSTLVGIGDGAFQRNTGLTSITLPSSLTSLGDAVFSGCSGLTTAVISGPLKELPTGTFLGCSALTSVTLPDGLTTIGDKAFGDFAAGSVCCTSLASISIPASVTEIGSGAFAGCTSLTSVALPQNLNTLGERAFFKCSGLTAIEIPEGVTEIAANTFTNCSALNTVVLPSKLSSVGTAAFANALSGQNAILALKGTTPPTTFATDAFGKKSGSPVVLQNLMALVPSGSESAYSEDNYTLKPYIKDGSPFGVTLGDKSVKSGKTVALTGITLPTGAMLTVTSDDAAVTVPTATTAEVTGASAGTATITVTMTVNGFELATDTCTVTVAAETHTVAFEVNGGSAVAPVTVEDGTPVTAPAAPTKSGYNFGGWYSDAELTTPYAFDTPVTRDITLYAKWDVKPTPPSTGGGSSSSTTTTTEKNPDGSTTTTTTDKKTGTVTEVTKQPDGTTSTVETKKDGTVTETGKTADGVTGTVVTAPDGAVSEITAEIPNKAAQSGQTVTLPVEIPVADSADEAPVVKISMPKHNGGVAIEIPVAEVNPGLVAVIVEPDGTETIVKDCVVTENGVVLTLDGSTELKIVDNSKTFVDVTEDDWAADAVNFVAARELFQGYHNSFMPDLTMTRGMMIQLLHNLEDNPDSAAEAVFDDVADDAWYADSVQWAVENHIVEGYAGSFLPDAALSREQLAVMLYRYAGSPAVADDDLTFADADEISGYAQAAMRWAVQSGLMQGDANRLSPKGTADRAQVAQLFKNFMEFMAK